MILDKRGYKLFGFQDSHIQSWKIKKKFDQNQYLFKPLNTVYLKCILQMDKDAKKHQIFVYNKVYRNIFYFEITSPQIINTNLINGQQESIKCFLKRSMKCFWKITKNQEIKMIYQKMVWEIQETLILIQVKHMVCQLIKLVNFNKLVINSGYNVANRKLDRIKWKQILYKTLLFLLIFLLGTIDVVYLGFKITKQFLIKISIKHQFFKNSLK